MITFEMGVSITTDLSGEAIPVPDDSLLTEDGFQLLTEDGFPLLVE